MELTVVIADDSALMRERLESLLLEIEGVEVVGKTLNVMETLKTVENTIPDVVILDIKMIGGNGIDVLKAIRKKNITSKVIVFTHFPYPQYKQACMNAGADYFFHKATQFEELIETIDDMKKQKS